MGSLTLDESVCGWKFPDEEVCGGPAAAVVEVQLPDVPGVVYAEGVDRVRMGICDAHTDLLREADPKAERYSMQGANYGSGESPFVEQFGDVGYLVPASHIGHRNHHRGCLGCDLTFGVQLNG